MTQLVFIILMYWFQCSSIIVRGQFEVIEGEEDAKISMECEGLQQYDEIQKRKSKFSKESGHRKFPNNFRQTYPPSAPYLLWLENNKQFPKWVYDMVRSKYHDDNLEWRINELSKLYKKCDMITEGYPLSGIYIRHLIDMINLQKHIDDHSIIQDISTKQDLDYLRNVHLPKANNGKIRLFLRDEDEIMKKVDPIGYLKSLAMRSPSVRNLLYRKYLSILQDDFSNDDIEILEDVVKQRNGINRLQRRNTTKRKSINKLIKKTKSESLPVISVSDYNPISKMQNVIDLVEDPGLNISMSLRKELRQVCKDYLNNYLEETYNVTNILKKYLEEKQQTDDRKYKKVSDLSLDQMVEGIGAEAKGNNDYKNKLTRKQGNTMFKDVIINKNINEIKNKNITVGDRMYSNLKLKSSLEDNKKRHKFYKLSEFIENTKIYKKLKKEFSDNYVLSKYDLIDVLENIGYDLPHQSKQDLTYLYGELLKNKQKNRLKEVFNEQNISLCFPSMNYEAVIDMLTSLMLCNINIRRRKNMPKLANVLENLGFNMTKSAKKKINKLYFAKIKSNSNNSRQY